MELSFHRLSQRESDCKNELGELFFMECEEEVAPIGTVVTADLLTTIEKLPETEYQEIKKIYEYHAD